MNRSTASRVAAFAFVLALSGCADKKAVKVAPPPPPPPMPAMPYVQRLSADSLFSFGKSDLSGMGAEGRAELDALASKILAGGPIDVIHVIGHSDRVGTDKANLALSTKRANSVRDYLVQRGVPAAKITAVGRGSVEPVVTCDKERGKAMIACLAPNRRVEIRVIPAK